jgi:hypothetical protein
MPWLENAVRMDFEAKMRDLPNNLGLFHKLDDIQPCVGRQVLSPVEGA